MTNFATSDNTLVCLLEFSKQKTPFERPSEGVLKKSKTIIVHIKIKIDKQMFSLIKMVVFFSFLKKFSK